jgi:di/tripeptidase
MGGLDIIVLMPNTRNVHTPDETIELASFDRTCQYLIRILERLAADCQKRG